MSVFIKLTDRSWIIERLAKELSTRLSYVNYDLKLPQSPTEALYLMTYSAFSDADIAKHRLAFFTHLEEDAGEEVKRRFFDVASKVDRRICMATRYANLLERRGMGPSDVIKPGVDLVQYSVKLKIGVVGRTYHTGRKGEALVKEVMDIPHIQWLFTGSGWPAKNSFIAEEDMADFYRSLDYLLVPSRYEGGPMPVLESLACGTPVIAPDIGFLNDYPHIHYKTNDAADLKLTLQRLIAEKNELRDSVSHTNWDSWAEKHDKIFGLMGIDRNVKSGRVKRKTVKLIIHGTEHRTLGGPSLRVPRTRNELRSVGWDAECISNINSKSIVAFRYRTHI